MIPIALTIAGSDPSGGAGLQADLKVFHQFGVYGQAIPTLITVQNTLGIRSVHPLPPDLVLAQLEALLEDFPPQAAKTGAGTPSSLAAGLSAAKFPVVLDPIMQSSSGARLGTPNILDLIPHCTLITPNLSEAATLVGFPVITIPDMRRAAQHLHRLGAPSVLVKGGHLQGREATDVLLHRGEFTELSAPKIDTPHTHGTGCAYSAAITALLACGLTIPKAVERAKSFVTAAIRTNPGLGRGAGPLNHWA